MVEHTILGWVIGLGVVSLLLGSVVSFIVWRVLHNYFGWLNVDREWNLSPDFTTTIWLYPVLTGILERLFFTVLIAFQVTGVGGGLVGWIGVKLAVGWGSVKEGKTANRALAFTGLLSNLTSLFFAVLGGLICNGMIPMHKLWG